MLPDDRDSAYLWDMLDAAVTALRYVDGLTKEQAIGDELRMSAFERKLEIIGEAARRVSATFTKAHPEVPWRGVIDLRNVIAHNYGEINRRQLFETATQEQPALIASLRTLQPPLED